MYQVCAVLWDFLIFLKNLNQFSTLVNIKKLKKKKKMHLMVKALTEVSRRPELKHF